MKPAGKAPPQPPAKKGQAPPVKEAPKEWRAEDYVGPHATIEEVRDVKAAFDIFDTDNSGLVDASELKQAFISLGLAHANKLVYNIMHSLDGEHPDGLNFAEFLKLATGRFGEAHSRQQIENVFKSFDHERNVIPLLFREESTPRSSSMWLWSWENTFPTTKSRKSSRRLTLTEMAT